MSLAVTKMMTRKRARSNAISDADKKNEAAPPVEMCGICLEPLSSEFFTYKCTHRVCGACFLNSACPTRPEANTNERNDMRTSASRCPYCRDEMSPTMKEAVSERMDALIARPVSEAEFRMSRTADAHRFFEGEVTCSCTEFLDNLGALCTTSEKTWQLMDILSRRYNKLTSDTGESPIPSRDHAIYCGMTSETVNKRVIRIGKMLYDGGYITPCFIYNLHHAGFPIGGASALIVAEETMAMATVSKGEVRAIRKALESIAKTRKDAMDYYAQPNHYYYPVHVNLPGHPSSGRIMSRVHFGIGHREGHPMRPPEDEEVGR